jgi:uncharacterized membrane protein YbhN (UPF0104 family)
MNRRTLKIALGLIAIACFLYVGRRYFGELGQVKNAHWVGVVGIAVVHLLTLKWGLDAFDNSITERESFILFVISSYANLVLPRSGVGTTAVYLNRARKTSMIDYSSVVLFNAALFVFACSAMGCLVFGIDWLVTSQSPPWWIAFGMPAFLVISLIAIFFRWSLVSGYKGVFHSLVGRMAHANDRLSGSGNLKRIGLAHFVLVFLRAFRLYVAFWAMGIEVSFFAVLLTSVLGDLAFVIAITPNAIGFREAAIAIAASNLGVSVSTALSVAILDRLVFSLTVVIVAQLLIGFVIKRPSVQSASSELAR